MPRPIVYLMYHELRLPDRSLVRNEPGYTRYAVSAHDFRAHLETLRAAGIQGVRVSQALAVNKDQPRVAITFDDGCETDLLAAAPILRDLGFTATFYVVAGWIGRDGYLNPNQLRELSQQHE